jgi:hypothetical protein
MGNVSTIWRHGNNFFKGGSIQRRTYSSERRGWHIIAIRIIIVKG